MRTARTQVNEANAEKVLDVAPTSAPSAPEGVGCMEVKLSKPLAAGDTVTLESSAVFTAIMTPYPAQVNQGDPHLVLYHDNVYVISPYPVSSQTTEVLLASSNVKSFTEAKPTKKADSRITYGRYDAMKPFTMLDMRLHFENTRPFMQVTTLVREIEVSHWGRIYVEESYEIRNAGEPAAPKHRP